MSFFFKGLEGVELKLSGKTYIVPPMNFKTIIRANPLFKDLAGFQVGVMPTETHLYCIARIIHLALRRNYPFIRLSTVINGLDMANMDSNLVLIMTGSGAVSKGEAKAVSQ
jgi:hypothetical protein